ncbi:MAG: hypothetical protein ABI333_20300 [bacterium]
MRMLRNGFGLALLAVGVVLSMASSWDDGEGGPDSWEDDWQEPEPLIIDDTWVVESLFDGQTGVSRDVVIRLTIGEEDLGAEHVWAVQDVLLYREDDGTHLPIDTEVYFETSMIRPRDGLAPDTDYVLDLQSLEPQLVSIRTLPGLIHFSTRSAPKVTGLWRSGDTLIVTFSESMDPASLFIGQTSLDVLWEEDGALRSIAADHNLAGYAWEAADLLFMMAPIDFADALGDVWVKVAADVRGASGVLLDGDADGTAGQSHDDYFAQIDTLALPTCFTRSDIPMPCVHQDEVPDNSDWRW